MIKRVFIFVFAVMTVLGARAQWSVEVTAGYDYNSHYYTKGYAYDLRYEGRGGFSMSIPVQYAVPLSLSPPVANPYFLLMIV